VSYVCPGGINTNIVDFGVVKSNQAGNTQTKQQASDNFKTLANTSPKKAAQTIISGIRRNKHEILIGIDASLLSRIARFFPGLMRQLILLHHTFSTRN
jgi:short-subunit dehydrogenase